ncbi:hypothetical protein P5704_026660 (plasmid) [Pseudomonas sp. FeN3W]|nr:hypothetical protein P5704_026660 [Pseudomonas sp. FeN3W]
MEISLYVSFWSPVGSEKGSRDQRRPPGLWFYITSGDLGIARFFVNFFISFDGIIPMSQIHVFFKGLKAITT